MEQTESMHGHGLFLWDSKHMHFRQCIAFYPNNLARLPLCQGAQVGSVCGMQLRPSDIVVSPVILRLYQWSPF